MREMRMVNIRCNNRCRRANKHGKDDININNQGNIIRKQC